MIEPMCIPIFPCERQGHPEFRRLEDHNQEPQLMIYFRSKSETSEPSETVHEEAESAI